MHRYLPALFLTYGHEVAYLPVNDRPRRAGVSKYNNLSRALIGLYDLFGVVWLRRRTRVPVIVEALPEGRHVSEFASRMRGWSASQRKSAGDNI
jgi:dolichol-phosphate mannosyltransferase